jgi:hypothetical protein
VFGQLTVLRRAPPLNGHTRWVCRCSCGTERTFFANNLKQGSPTHCGCVRAAVRVALAARLSEQHERGRAKRQRAQRRARRTARGAVRGAERKRIAALKRQHRTTWGTWIQMIGRCTNPSHGDYPNYGRRGIRVCRRWRRSFETFLQDVGTRPVGHTLHRRDNNGHYEPANCRWATYTEQNRNSRHCKLTEPAVREIVRTLARTPPTVGFGERYGDLATRYGVTTTAIYMVDTGRAWRDVVVAARRQPGSPA